MTALFNALLISAAAIAPLMMAVAVVALSRYYDKLDGRRSPLTTRLHRLPGENCLRAQDKQTEDISTHLLILMVLGPTGLILVGLNKIDLNTIELVTVDWIVIASVAILSAWYGVQLVKLVRVKRRYAQGREAELATAQELMSVTRRGCDVYHSVPIGGVDIDHVVVGPDTVYCVETKSRLKPKGRGRKQAEVKFTKERLEFPGWFESRPLDQCRHHARILAEHLYRKTGERVLVCPVLALPGWYVANAEKYPGDIRVINPKNVIFMAELTHAQIQRAQRRRILTAIEDLFDNHDGN